MYSTRYFGQTVINFELSRQIFEICSNIKFHEHPFSGSRSMRTDTDTRNLTVAFRNFANAPSK
jgi:hypothetical protein